MRADHWHTEIQGMQANFEKMLPALTELMAALRQAGYADEEEIEAQLKISETGDQIFFPKYGVMANLPDRH